MTKKILFLLPNVLGEDQPIEHVVPFERMKTVLLSLEGLIVENEKIARRYVLKFITREEYQKLSIHLLNEHSSEKDKLDLALKVTHSNGNWGLITDAGLPCIADPGSDLVFLLRDKHVSIEALVGPSSIVAALMLSGFSGQRFSFEGYLPREEKGIVTKLKEMEKQSSKEKKTFLWMDTPYRTDKHLELVIKTLHEKTYLCVAANLLLESQKVVVKSVKDWRKDKPTFGKTPAIFLLYSKG